MTDQTGLQEIVVLFAADGTAVDRELRMEDFEALVAGETALPERAASVVRAAYAVVGAGLAVRGVAFFQFRVTEEGLLDPTFNLPLRYMVENAGPGPQIVDVGPFRLACRSQCPVPWHAVHLWEPAGQGDDHPIKRVQKLVWRNSLGIKPLPGPGDDWDLPASTGDSGRVLDVDGGFAGDLESEPLPKPVNGKRPGTDFAARPAQARRTGKDDRERLRAVADGGPRNAARRPSGSALAEHRRYDAQLTAVFGEEGRLNLSQLTHQHRDQIAQIQAKFRDELHQQQQNYLEQIRGAREEIQKLKAALRHEQERNRRLQGLLRGEV
ncbi:MAG: hypothetical protein R3E86_17905 [Pseudomonadales bacterium]